MLKNYLKTALRNIKRNKLYTFITVFGLATGMMCALFILVFARHELSHDRFHRDVDSIYQVLTQADFKNNSITPTALAPLLTEGFPEIVKASRYHWFWGETVLQYDQEIFYENAIRLVDPDFFDIFNFSFIKGDPKNALADPNSIVMTRQLAEKYFGNDDPLGKTVILNHKYPLTVTAVMNDVPENSSMKFDMLMPIQFNITDKADWYMAWNNLFVYTFIKCRENTSPEALKTKIEGIIGEQGGGENTLLSLLPFKDRYFLFYSDKTTVIVLLSVAAFILLIAAFNFLNLSTAQSFRRVKEIGMRKMLGARKRQIVVQYLGESALLAIISAILAIILFYNLLPVFQIITGSEIEIAISFVIYSLLAFALMTGLIAGIYPAFFLSAFGIGRALKGRGGTSMKGGGLRKGIVIIQFILSILLLLGVTVVYQQMDYLQKKDLGYHKEDIVVLKMGGGSEKYYQIFKSELQKEADIENVSGMALPLPFFGWRINAFKWEGKDPDEKVSISYNEMDYDFLKTMDIKLLAGRDMSREFAADEGSGVFINEKMTELMGTNSAVGATIMQGDEFLTVIGVLENFHFTSMSNEIEPLILLLNPSNVDNIFIRILPGSGMETLTKIKSKWEKTIPGYPFQFSYLDEDFERSLTSIKQTGLLLTAFAVLAIIISCLGLFGLSSLLAEQSTKEIGIRKVHGASVFDIIKQFAMKFIPLVLIANVIVLPLAYYLMNQWLNNFAYRTTIQFHLFLLTSILSLLVAFLSVSYKSIKAANANPVDALKYE